MPPSKKSHYFSPRQKAESHPHKIFEAIKGHTLALSTDAGMFSPDEIDKGTRILIENIMLPEKGAILDLGAGYGTISIWLIKELSMLFQLGKRTEATPAIYASEVNERAVRLLTRNIVENKAEGIRVLKGDFSDTAKELHDSNVRLGVVYCNPPLKAGHEKMLEIFQNAMNLLEPFGFIQYVHKKSLGAEGFLEKLKTLRPTWFFKVIRKKGGYYVIVGSPIDFVQETREKDDLEAYFGESYHNDSPPN
jgi:16S rRNA (guanine1207-N2)-methyltransferase